MRSAAICISPPYVAEELFRLEGFTDVQYVPFKSGNLFTQAVSAGEVGLALNFIGPLVVSVDERAPVVILAGVHAGCFELFGSERVRTIRDLKGKTVAIPGKGEPQHVFLASMLSHVGIAFPLVATPLAYPLGCLWAELHSDSRDRWAEPRKLLPAVLVQAAEKEGPPGKCLIYRRAPRRSTSGWRRRRRQI